jgi:hypothetical protein
VILVLALALLPCARGSGETVATFLLVDGTKVKAEIYKFDEGKFFLRDVEGGAEFEEEEKDVVSIEFGATAPTTPPEDRHVGEVMTLIEEHRYFVVLDWATRHVRAGRREPVRDLEKTIKQELDKPAVSKERRRDLLLAGVVLHAAQGETGPARRMYGEILRDYPDDDVVRRFEMSMQWLRRRRDGRPAPRRRGERRPNAPPE